MPADVEITIAGHPRWLRLARSVVQEFCSALDVADEHTQSIVVAVDEALSNVIKHAYHGDTSKLVKLICAVENNELVFEIRDHGAAFNPLDRDVPPPDEMRSGGRGLFLMREIMDTIDYRRDGECNCVRLSKSLDPAIRST